MTPATRFARERIEEAVAPPAFARDVLVRCLEESPSLRLTVSGGCMSPALRAGEQVTLVGTARRRPRAGDVVLATTAEGLRLHRLVWAPRGRRWRTKADRAPTWDGAVSDADVLATAVEVSGDGAPRPTRSTIRLVAAWAAVALAHGRALARRLCGR